MAALPPDEVEGSSGARFLRDQGAVARLASLVAHHSCAVHEARVRELDGVLLAEFEAEDSPNYDALVFCDLTTGRYRTIQIRVGQQVLTAEDPLPPDLRDALALITRPGPAH
jgi:hypothetical protein